MLLFYYVFYPSKNRERKLYSTKSDSEIIILYVHSVIFLSMKKKGKDSQKHKILLLFIDSNRSMIVQLAHHLWSKTDERLLV